MDFSSIWNTGTLILSGGAALVGGALGMVLKGIDARQKLATLNRELQAAKDDAQARRAVAVRAAREAASRLETFAHACHARLTENELGLRTGGAIRFRLPKVAPGAGVGDSPEALALESAYRDLEQQVQSANQHIEETCRDDYHAGPAEALRVLDVRAYEIAASALKLASRYRERFGVPRMPLGGREQRIEDEIVARAADTDSASTGGR